MSQPDLICVVSGGCVPTTELRIEKALQRFYESKAGIFLLNGFNTKEEHDEGFNGDSWRDDFRLINCYHDLEKINPSVVHAKNTIVNGIKLREALYNLKLKNAETVTSETHMKRLRRIFYSVFPQGEFENLSFSQSKEPNRRLYELRTIVELAEYSFTEAMLSGIERGDWDIAKKYDEKRYYSPIGKTLSGLKSIFK